VRDDRRIPDIKCNANNLVHAGQKVVLNFPLRLLDLFDDCRPDKYME